MRPVASPLFQGLSAEEWAALEQSGCLRTKSYPRHAVIFHAGAQVHALGVVLRGTVHIENLDLWGSKSILSSISAGQAFAETYALCGDVMMVDAVAAEECEVLFVNISAFSGGAPGTVHEKLLRNLDKEIPHGTAVEITRFIERDDEVIEVDATIYCEKASHKGIIIGKNGAMLKKISTEARQDIERFMGTKVYLETWVKVKENWRDNMNYIRSFGYDEQ